MQILNSVKDPNTSSVPGVALCPINIPPCSRAGSAQYPAAEAGLSLLHHHLYTYFTCALNHVASPSLEWEA